MFDKYEDEEKFPTSKCGLPVRTSTKPKSVSSTVDDGNITLTSLTIILNYIRDAFGKRDILAEEAVQSLGTRYMETEYRTYEINKEKGM